MEVKGCLDIELDSLFPPFYGAVRVTGRNGSLGDYSTSEMAQFCNGAFNFFGDLLVSRAPQKREASPWTQTLAKLLLGHASSCTGK